MEFLFILFVLYMIFSAVTRGLKAATEQNKTPEQERERGLRDPVVDEDPRTATEPTESVWFEHLYPDEPLLQQEAMVDDKPYVSDQRIKPPTREKQLPKVELARGARAQQHKVSRSTGDRRESQQTAQPKLGLDYLIRSKNLPLAIIAAEVISSPRSKKPFSQRNRG